MLNDHSFRLYLIRHGESEFNVQPDLMGQTPDIPLTIHGVAQAKKLQKKFARIGFKPDFIYSSHYERALNTAKIVFPNADIILAPELREYDAGDWTHGKRSELITPDVIMKMNNLTQSFQPPNGESTNQVERRASKWLEENILYNKEMMDFSRENGEVKIVCFSHGLTIKSLLHYVMGFDKSFTWKIEIDNTSISTFSFGKVGWRLHGINDCSHYFE